MKTVILAGGLGTRLAEETDLIPKPMVEVGGQPILWHIMRHYARFGFKEFVLALGYKSWIVKRFFLDMSTVTNSITVETRTGTCRCTRMQPIWTGRCISSRPASRRRRAVVSVRCCR